MSDQWSSLRRRTGQIWVSIELRGRKSLVSGSSRIGQISETSAQGQNQKHFSGRNIRDRNKTDMERCRSEHEGLWTGKVQFRTDKWRIDHVRGQVSTGTRKIRGQDRHGPWVTDRTVRWGARQFSSRSIQVSGRSGQSWKMSDSEDRLGKSRVIAWSLGTDDRTGEKEVRNRSA